jgi:cold shock CspA family protein
VVGVKIHSVRRLRIVLLILVSVALVIGVIYYSVGYFRPKGAGLIVETNPNSEVFIDGEMVGRTPYKEIHEPKEVILKLVPESFEQPLAPYETRLKLVSGIETVVRRDFAETEENSAGETISFEREASGETSLAIVSNPDSAQVAIDGVTRAFSPYKTSDITEGEHTLLISAEGYLDRSFEVVVHEGYKLTASVKLSPDPDYTPPEEEEDPIGEDEDEEGESVVVVTILSTPTNFLRVREDASTQSAEVGRVTPGETYVFVEEDEDSGWLKIEFDEEGNTGWVSGTYAEKLLRIVTTKTQLNR